MQKRNSTHSNNSTEEIQVKVLCSDEALNIEDDLSSLKSPVRMPQTQFLNIFKQDTKQSESVQQHTKSVLSNTLDKAHWSNSTLACTI